MFINFSFSGKKSLTVRLIIGSLGTDGKSLSNPEHIMLNPEIPRPHIGERIILKNVGWEMRGRVIDITTNYMINQIDIWAAKEKL